MIEAILGDDPRPIAILGPPGIGKSALTRQALHEPSIALRYGARRWFVRLDAATDERAFWTSILGALSTITPAANPATQVLTLLGEGPGLLILDNLETPWHAADVPVEAALARLADVPGCRMIGSIRGTAWPGSVDWLHLPTLDSLPTDEARELFLRVAGQQYAADPALDGLIAALDGLPLAIDLLARQAQGSRELTALREDFDRRKAAIFEIGEGKERSLEASLQLSLDSPRMTSEGKRLFTALGRLPAGAALQDLGKLIQGGQAAGRVLRQVGLAYEEQGRLRMLAPIREHAAHRRMDVKKLVGHYLDLARVEGGKVGKASGAEALARLTPEIANLEAAFDLAIRERQTTKKAVAAVDGLGDLMGFTGHGSAKPLQALANAVHKMGDPRSEAHCQFRLGELLLRRSEQAAARERFEAALTLYQKVGHEQGEATCVLCIGDIALRHSEHDSARECFEAAFTLYRKVGDLQGEANCVLSLGEIALLRSEHDAAGERFKATLTLYRKLGNVLGEANCVRGLGDIALRRSEHDAAGEHFKAALTLYRRVGHVQGEANCLWGFGEIARERSELVGAEAQYEMALALFRQVQSLAGAAFCLLGIGQIGRELGRAEAGDQLRKALSLLDEVRHLEGRGRVLIELAELAEGVGEKRRLLLDALDSHQRFGNPRWIGEAHRRLARLSEGEERARHIAAARAAWTSIDRPDLVAELDGEINASMHVPQQK